MRRDRRRRGGKGRLSVAARLRRWLVAGVLALTPLLVTALLIDWLLGVGETLLGWLPPAWRPQAWLGFETPAFGVAMALIFVLAVGALTTQLLGARIMRAIDRLMERIPLISTLHRATRQLLDAVLREDSNAFQQVVLAPFPSRDTRVIGFVTGYATGKDGERLAAVFVPSTPVPSTGWLLFVAPELLTPLDLSIDDAMKLVLSGGALVGEVWQERR